MIAELKLSNPFLTPEGPHRDYKPNIPCWSQQTRSKFDEFVTLANPVIEYSSRTINPRTGEANFVAADTLCNFDKLLPLFANDTRSLANLMSEAVSQSPISKDNDEITLYYHQAIQKALRLADNNTSEGIKLAIRQFLEHVEEANICLPHNHGMILLHLAYPGWRNDEERKAKRHLVSNTPMKR